jgi:3-deoxy-D-manno-octulosonic-acid transferase
MGAMYLLYGLGLALALLIASPYLLVGTLRGKYRPGFGERRGRVPERILGSSRPVIWVHAVSVGEALAVAPLVEELRRRHPERRVVVSTTTPTGQKLARERFGADNVFFFPFDFAFCIRPYLRALKPELVVLAETEFWPNFIRLAAASGATLAVVNARISDRSFPKYRALRAIWRRVLAHIDIFLTQSETDRERLLAIGVAAEKVRVSGNLKFDVAPPPEPEIVRQLHAALQREGAGPVIVAGSTMEAEEPLVLNAFRVVKEKAPGAVLILAPRRPERFEPASAAAAQRSTTHRRSTWKGEPLAGSIFVVDTLGELAAMYALADIAFVGGSLANHGGHNILEPAMLGKAIVVGPYTQNFRAIVNEFERHGALARTSSECFADDLRELAGDQARRIEMGRAARQLFAASQGARDRTADALDMLLARRLPAVAR